MNLRSIFAAGFFISKVYSKLFLAALVLIYSCTPPTQYTGHRRSIGPESLDKLDRNSEYLKAHMANGRVYVLQSWKTNDSLKIVSGQGTLYDVNRDMLSEGFFNLSSDSVVIFETNTLLKSKVVQPILVVTALSLAVSALCLIPKACFGSCPTYYISDGESMVLQAEGFSSSTTPSLEENDIDALYLAKPTGKTIELRVTNEAMESHYIRSLNLLAAPKPAGGRIIRTLDNHFYEAKLIEPQSCTAREGDILPIVAGFDGQERFSPAHEKNLATREYIELYFPDAPAGELALVLGKRNTLLTTFLYYQVLAYMGSQRAHLIYEMETGKPLLRTFRKNLIKALGGIEVQVLKSGSQWRTVGMDMEAGPIATEVSAIKLPDHPGGDLRLRLKLTQGLWRIDYLALAFLGNLVEPVRLAPTLVLKDGIPPTDELAALHNPNDFLDTYMGDAYTVLFDRPEGESDWEWFLESQGYYIEWTREAWLEEESAANLAKVFLTPGQMLKDLAPVYKSLEPKMEMSFWNSRYENP